MGLKSELIKSLADYGLQQPSSIQQRVVAPAVQGISVLVQCAPGIDKLVTIAIAATQVATIDTPPTTQVIIVAGSQEAALKIEEITSILAKPLGVIVAPAVGGTGVQAMIDKLQEGAHIIVASAGRLYDAFKRGAVSQSTVRFLFVDGADWYLRQTLQRKHMGEMIGALDATTSVNLFFQRYTDGVDSVVKEYLAESDTVQVVDEVKMPKGVSHSYVEIPDDHDLCDALLGLNLNALSTRTIIIGNNKNAMLARGVLNANGCTVSSLFGRLDHLDRAKAVQNFDKASHPILATTNNSLDVLTGRADFVINCEVPRDSRDYVARSLVCKANGRVLTLVTPHQRAEFLKLLSELKPMIGIKA